MLSNWIVVFLIPWIFGIVFYFKDRKTLFTIAPVQSTIAYTINTWGIHYGFWHIRPFELNKVASVPFELGIYPILAVALIFFVRKLKINSYIIILLATVFTTALEYLGIRIGRVIYSNGWNIYWTFVSYLIPYMLCYWYYLQLRKLKIMD